ncbi:MULTISPECIES: hypothetical protein [Nocardioides]|uniref:Uncharacterized protein n=1 Tax=Nocardioides vastitatis TaxID=2568655 RepID=A0ABW0ZJ74_9ACTN|nr:hypothetical protein [Nocardioides sp.]THJ13723.1 hypothetical protein E7Z54_01570 [Nocardioides sp.]
MSTLTATKPAQPAPTPPAPQQKSEPPLWARYIGAMLYFMGAALIAGGVVHYPIDPPQYTVITIIGALVFALGTVFNEFVLAPERPTLRRAVWAVTISLFLSFGVGLTGGGIQHFDQFPERCAIMTPIGLAMSYVAFVLKDKEGSWRNLVGLFAAGVAAFTIAVWLGMSALAANIEPASHDHGSTPDTPSSPSEPNDHDNHEQAPAPADQQPADDGHTGHSH